MIQQWSQLEQIRYHFFLILRLDRFRVKPKKNSNIFKEMHAFMRTKSPEQCRSHHQKRVQSKDILQIIRTFFYNYYQIRFLDIEHAKAELKYYLTKVNPAFLTGNNHNRREEDLLCHLLHELQQNLKTVLPAKLKDQNTQTSPREEDPEPVTEERLIEVPALLFDNTQDSHPHLIVESYNSDIQNL